MGLEEVEMQRLDWINVAQDMDNWRTVVNTVTNFIFMGLCIVILLSINVQQDTTINSLSYP